MSKPRGAYYTAFSLFNNIFLRFPLLILPNNNGNMAICLSYFCDYVIIKKITSGRER